MCERQTKAVAQLKQLKVVRLHPFSRWGDEIFTSEFDSSADAHVTRKRKENADFHVVHRLANTRGATRLFFFSCLCLCGTWGPLKWPSHCLPGQLHRPPPEAPPRRPQPSEAERQPAVSREFKAPQWNWRVGEETETSRGHILKLAPSPLPSSPVN